MISEVVMARMLIARSASALNAVAATPAWLLMPMPITETLGHALVMLDHVEADAGLDFFEHGQGLIHIA